MKHKLSDGTVVGENHFQRMFTTTFQLLNVFRGDPVDATLRIKELEMKGITLKDFATDMIGRIIRWEEWYPEGYVRIGRIKELDNSDPFHKYEKVYADVFTHIGKKWIFEPNVLVSISTLYQAKNLNFYPKHQYDKKFINTIGKDYLNTLKLW